MKKLVLFGILVGLIMAGCGSGVKKWEGKILAEENADVRREYIVELMSQWGGKSDDAVRLFAMLAKTDADPTVRSAAVRGLGESKNPSAVGPLTEVLDNETDEYIRRDAAMALGKVHGLEAVRTLVEHLRADADDHVRAACARSLGEYKYPGVVQTLVAGLLAEDFSIVFEAQRSLEKLTGKKFESSQDWQNWLDENGDPFP